MELSTNFVFVSGENKAQPINKSNTMNLHKYVGETLESKKKGLSKAYNQMLTDLETTLTEKPHELIPWLRALSQNVSLLTETDHDKLVFTIAMKFEWERAEDEVVALYTDLILNLLSANGCFAHHCTKSLVRNLNPIRTRSSTSNDSNSSQSDAPNTTYDEALTEKVNNYIHQAIQSILSIVPSASTPLFFSLQNQFPSRRADVETHRVYFQNLLKIVRYFPALRDRVLGLCVDKLVQLDVIIKLDEALDDDDLVFEVEMDSVPDTAEKLDVMMDLMFSYIEDCISMGKASELWTVVLKLFDTKILTTHKSKYVQFLLFYLCKADQTFSEQFLHHLKGRLIDSKNHGLTRQICSAYVGSFMSRANFIDIQSIRLVLNDLSSWAVSFMETISSIKVTPDADLYGLFYSVCQSIFYVICFHHEQLFGEKSGIQYAESLQLEKLACSPLNPLKFCLVAVVNEFGRICGSLGFVSVCEVIEKNKSLVLPTRGLLGGNNQLDSFFPFDPYLLRISSNRITPIYKSWNASSSESMTEAVEEEEGEAVEEDDGDSPSDSLGSDLKSMSLTPVGKTLDLHFHFRNRSGSTTSPNLLNETKV